MIAAVSWVGCTGTQLTQSADLEITRKRQDELLNEIQKVRELHEIETERRARSEADIEDKLDDFAARFERLEYQLKDLLDGLARQQQLAPLRGGAVGAMPDAGDGGSGDRPPGSGDGTSDGTPGEAPSELPAQPYADPRAEYDAAYLEVTRGHFDAAIGAFDAFLVRHPSTELSDNALYWIGECHYASERYDPAVEAFVRLMDSYPTGDKVPAAMLKLGYAFRARGDVDAARRYLEALVAQHPNTDEAGLARRRLEEL
jgi:tol-pal system protein YbgF